MTITLTRITSCGREKGTADLNVHWDGGSIVLKLGLVRVSLTRADWLRFVRGITPDLHCGSC